ncbi:MAG: hypothetical protein ACOX6D_02890 [Thermoguttaceae bacterium]
MDCKSMLPSHNPKNRILREGTRLAYLIALSLSGMLLLYGDVKGVENRSILPGPVPDSPVIETFESTAGFEPK